MARPRKEINWDEFARDVATEIWGGLLPARIDAVKCVKRMVRALPLEERRSWLGTPFLRTRYQSMSIESKLATAVRQWVMGHAAPGESALEFCGFTISELMGHIEAQFQPWMRWQNWGAWHIDHVIPRRLYGKPFGRAEIFGLQNLRPIARATNLAKGGKHE